MSADIHRQRRRVSTPLTIPFTASTRGQVNEDRFGDMGPVPNFMLRQSKNVTYASPTARLQRAIAHFWKICAWAGTDYICSAWGHVCLGNRTVSGPRRRLCAGGNIAAHPSGVLVAAPTAEEFIKDLIENVVLKLS